MPDKKEKLALAICQATQKTNYMCDFNCGKKGQCAYCLVMAEQMIANGVTVQQWIPVTERMPEDDLPSNTHRSQIRCLVATDKGTVKRCVRQRYEKKIDGKWQLSGWEWNKDTFAKPTHWMPLPEPPKEVPKNA